MTDESKRPFFRDIDADDDVPEVTVVESMCVDCEENGTTRLFMTKIPFFKEVILSSFECSHCGSKNNFVQPAGAYEDQGSKISLKVNCKEDLNRQVVKQKSASIVIPELDFETPAFTQEGELNTIEGLLQRVASGLEREQPVRRATAPDTANKIEAFLSELKKCITLERSFTFVVDDPSGNSFIENPNAPKEDPGLTVSHYTRTAEQDMKLGIQQPTEEEEEEEKEKIEESPGKLKDEVLTFATNCSQCQSPCETRMKVVEIPHFKEVIIMATTCDACGYKSNEVKSGSGIEPKGTKLTLNLTDTSDLSRDVLKSETCELSIPELDFTVTSGTLGGRFTTLEGLLSNVYDHLKSINPFGLGDSPGLTSGLPSFLMGLRKIIDGENLDVHIIMDDAAGNSYIQNLYAPDPDPELTIEHYERSEEQCDDLGLTGMHLGD